VLLLGSCGAPRFPSAVGRLPWGSRSTSAIVWVPAGAWLAADLLLEPGATIGSVAHQVGYGSAFALSTAFKRIRRVSPQQHRSAAAASARVGETG
jgi:hypothetical protein